MMADKESEESLQWTRAKRGETITVPPYIHPKNVASYVASLQARMSSSVTDAVTRSRFDWAESDNVNEVVTPYCARCWMRIARRVCGAYCSEKCAHDRSQDWRYTLTWTCDNPVEMLDRAANWALRKDPVTRAQQDARFKKWYGKKPTATRLQPIQLNLFTESEGE